MIEVTALYINQAMGCIVEDFEFEMK